MPTETARRAAPRRGLAPLEFVLWLPILLFVMALMVNYGSLAAWRVRGESVSRNAAWRTRWPRHGADEGRHRPTLEWQGGRWPFEDADMRRGGDAPITKLDDARIRAPVIRGPLPNGFSATDVLDPDARGALRGVAEIERGYPMLPRLGPYRSGEISTPLLGNRWQAAQMSIPNEYRRILKLYTLPQTEPSLRLAFKQAVLAVRAIPHYSALEVLQPAPEFLRYGWGAQDFYASCGLRVGSGCELDPETVFRRFLLREGRRTTPLIDRRDGEGEIQLGSICRLPRCLTNGYLNMYETTKRRLERELNGTPPPTPQRRAEIQRILAEIRPKIAQLKKYRARLDQLEADMRARAAAVL